MKLKAFKYLVASKSVYRNLPFVYFLAALGMIYIANAHFAEKSMREIQGMQRVIEEQRWKSMSVQAELKQKSLRSEVARMVAADGLITGTEAPELIKVKQRGIATDHE